MSEEEIIKLLKSGNFTITYHDNASPSLYKGKLDYEETGEADEIEVNYFNYGYCPEIVAILVKALGGKSDSI